jgi:hypothetical protein
MSAGFQTRISKAFRVRGTTARAIYYNARRAGRFFRDSVRRSAMAALPPTGVHIPREAGFVLVPGDRFEETPAIVADARAALSRFDASMPPGGKNRKRFLQNVLDPSTLTVESPIVRFALRGDVLSTVSEYLGVVPFLTAINVFHSDTVEGLPTSSQLYHCDGDDVTQIKIFIYCSDVDMRSGPLTILDADATRTVQRRTGYQYRQRLTDEQVHGVVGRGAEHPILGQSGASVFVDTSRCFHFGSRVAPDAPPRLVTMVQYQTPYSFMLPADAQASLPFRRFLASPSLTSLQRLVLGA